MIKITITKNKIFLNNRLNNYNQTNKNKWKKKEIHQLRKRKIKIYL